MKILLTGAAGFIGSAVCRRLIDRGDTVVGLDNINDYYDPELKYGRLAALGIARDDVDWYRFAVSSTDPRFSFIRMNLEDAQAMRMLFA
ncbi:MAG: NAD-dependent epimerase/dehydratase family protein, partial [Muribaculaceae bacterium]|nr:NAD-dependent epimerase/dehydratase family protein [Muribaculaceae bacterium]